MLTCCFLLLLADRSRLLQRLATNHTTAPRTSYNGGAKGPTKVMLTGRRTMTRDEGRGRSRVSAWAPPQGANTGAATSGSLAAHMLLAFCCLLLAAACCCCSPLNIAPTQNNLRTCCLLLAACCLLLRAAAPCCFRRLDHKTQNTVLGTGLATGLGVGLETETE